MWFFQQPYCPPVTHQLRRRRREEEEEMTGSSPPVLVFVARVVVVLVEGISGNRFWSHVIITLGVGAMAPSSLFEKKTAHIWIGG